MDRIKRLKELAAEFRKADTELDKAAGDQDEVFTILEDIRSIAEAMAHNIEDLKE